MRTKKADRLAATPKRKQVWVYQDKWVELHHEVQKLEQQVKYWRIESECNEGRWLSVLEEIDKLRKQIKEKQK